MIDAHVHIWNRATDPQRWIDPVAMAPIDRDFSTSDMEEMLDATGMGSAVVVQSSNSFAETRRLLAGATPRVAGVVGWLDLRNTPAEQFGGLHADDRFRMVGVRHLVHVDPDPAWLARDDVGRGLDALEALGLTFDLVVRWWQLPLVHTVAADHVGLRFVLDHLGGPPLGSPDLDTWASSLRLLGGLPNLSAKVSGAPATIGRDGSLVAAYRTVLATAMDAFGTDRLMYGSDWPLVGLVGGASRWRDAIEELLAELPETDLSALFGGNARRVYGLSDR